jgi:hypothetical protein
MMGAPYGGDPHDAGFVAVPPGILGAIVALLSGVTGSTVVAATWLAGGGLNGTAVWVTLGFVGLGLALVAWDRLTAVFQSTTPGEDLDEDHQAADEETPDAETALGSTVSAADLRDGDA